jgi:hypothetical protein
VKLLLASLVLAAALALPSLALAGGQTGIVAKVDTRSGLVAVVGAKGAVSLVHSPTPALRGLRPGSRVSFEARQLRNGTFSATGFDKTGRVRSVHVGGVVFAVDPKHGSFALSAHGAVLPLRLAKHARVLASCTCPKLNSTVDVTLGFGAGGQVDAAASTQVDPTADAGAIDGTVAIDASGEVTVSSGMYAITLLVPAWFDPSKLAAGEHVIAYFLRLPSGEYAIEAVANDGSIAQADDPNGEQGDVQNVENQVGVDEQSGVQANDDQTDTELAQAELAADEAAIANDLHELLQACLAHVNELSASGASAADLAAAIADCHQQLVQLEEQAAQDLQHCEQQVSEQVAGDPEAEQQLAQDERQAEQDLQESENQDAEQAADGSFDSGAPASDNSGSGGTASVRHH